MKKEDLKYGNVIELRNGKKFLYHRSGGFSLDGKITCQDVSSVFDTTRNYDIIRIYSDYTLKKLLWERKEKPKLTKDEKAILRNLPKKWKYIARDEDSCLWIFNDYKPRKGSTSPEWLGNIGEPLILFQHLFQFITWEDEEPTLIEDLLKN